MARHSTTRTDKAAQLIQSGAVQLFVGRGYALVTGKSGEYKVTKDGCTCPDAQYRERTGCCHALAVRQLCSEFRAHKAQAERGERVRPTNALLQAIRRPQPATRTPSVDDQSDLFNPSDFVRAVA